MHIFILRQLFDPRDLYEELGTQLEQNRFVQTFLLNWLNYSQLLNFLSHFGHLTETIQSEPWSQIDLGLAQKLSVILSNSRCFSTSLTTENLIQMLLYV